MKSNVILSRIRQKLYKPHRSSMANRFFYDLDEIEQLLKGKSKK